MSYETNAPALDRQMLERASNAIQRHDLLSHETISQIYGEGEGARSFWFVAGLFYGLEQKSGTRSKLAHMFDVSIRPDYRGIAQTTEEERRCAIQHDTVEDILESHRVKDAIEKRGGSLPHDAVAAYITLDIIAAVASEEQAYGTVVFEGTPNERRHGGTEALTNFNAFITDPLLKSRGYSNFVVGYTQEEGEYLRLGKKAKDDFSSRIQELRGQTRVTEEDIQELYAAVSDGLKTFATEISNKDTTPRVSLDDRERKEISDFVMEEIVPRVEDRKSSLPTEPVDITRRIEGDYDRVLGLAETQEFMLPNSLIGPTQSPHIILLETELYKDFITRQIGDPVRNVLRLMADTGDAPRYSLLIQSLNKLNDNTDSVGNIGSGIPVLFSHTRKGSIVSGDSRKLHSALRAFEAPEGWTKYLETLIGLHAERLSNEYRGSLRFQASRAFDSSHKIDTAYLEQLRAHIKDIREKARAIRPNIFSRLGTLNLL